MSLLITRRQFIVRGTMVLAGAAALGHPRSGRLLAAEAAAGDPAVKPVLRFGVVTDIHYAEKNPSGTRYYRDSLDKIKVAVAGLNESAKKDAAGLAFAVCLGDMVDSAGPTATDEVIAKEIGYLKTVEAEWSKVGAERHYVLGNHCVSTLKKEEFFANTKAKPAPYSFDVPLKGADGAMHFIVLDACYKADGTPYGRNNFDWRDTNLLEKDIAWLKDDLAKTKNRTIVFAHQRLDGSPRNDGANANIKNAAQVRPLLESSGKVLAVLQGHSHKNLLETVNGIPYCVLRGMIEDAGPANNAFATVEMFADGSIAIRGNFQQTTYGNLAAKAPAPETPVAPASPPSVAPVTSPVSSPPARAS